MRLPAAFDGDDKAAVALLESYLSPAPELPAGVSFTGSLFDTWDGGGDQPEVADVFTDADVTAVALLSVEIPVRAVVELLDRRKEKLCSLLSAIPTDLSLSGATAKDIGPGSTPWLAWDALLEIDDIGWVTAGKLLARKRPRLLPIYDRVARSVVGAPDNFWEELRQALQADDGALNTRLQAIAEAAGAPHLTPLRVFDIVAWMEGSQAAAG